MNWPAVSYTIFGSILNKINSKSDNLWSNRLDSQNKRISQRLKNEYAALKNIKKPITKYDFAKLVKDNSATKKITISKYCYLPPIHGSSFIPLLSFESDFTAGEMKIRYELAKYADDIFKNIVCIGYRYETGHKGGAHNYPHFQVSTKAIPSAPIFSGCPPWIPTSVPCVPIIADNPISFVLISLISIYGKDLFKYIFKPRDMQLFMPYIEPIKHIK